MALSDETLAVGAWLEDSSATGVNPGQPDDDLASASGAAYVYRRQQGIWSPEAYIKASNAEAGDHFGVRIALDGDTLVVGAWNEDSAATGIDGDQADNRALDSGAVYVFIRDGDSWVQEAYLKASNTDPADRFGSAIAICGDALAIGARNESSGASGVGGEQLNNDVSRSGAVYVFVRDSSGWSQEAYIKSSNPEDSDFFGDVVALSGNTLAVVAAGEDSAATGIDGDQADNNAPSAGAVYVFVRSGATWSQQAYLKPPKTCSLMDFGSSVALSGDTLLVGAPGENGGSTGIGGDPFDQSALTSGAAYTFTRSGTTWQLDEYIKASNAQTFDSFGGSVDLDGDLAIVGARNEDSSATGVDGPQTDSISSAGAAYTFVREAGSWAQQHYLKASNTEPNDLFGSHVGVSGDRFAAAAFFEDSAATGIEGDASDNSANNSGAVYTFQIDELGCTPYCPALPNATGSPAVLTGIEPSSSLLLRSTPVPNTVGQFFFGTSQLAGNPFGDGRLCVGGMVQRIHPLVYAGMMMQPPNTATLTVDYGAPYAAGLIGSKHFQHWFRSGVATGAGFDTSSAVSIQF